MKSSSVSVNNFKGIPIISYNDIACENNAEIEVDGKEYNGFYVSYNSHDVDIYGDVTTALVLGQMQKYFILNGDHRAEYARIIKSGFKRCIEYFVNNADKINRYSDIAV